MQKYTPTITNDINLQLNSDKKRIKQNKLF